MATRASHVLSTRQDELYRQCKMLTWAIRIRDEQGHDLSGVNVVAPLVRVTTKTLRDGKVVETYTSQALTRLSAMKMRVKHGRARPATSGELLDEAVQGCYRDALYAVVQAWRKQGAKLGDPRDEAHFPLALKSLALMETARRGERVSRARLIAEAIHLKWGAELEQIASDLYGAPYFTPDDVE